MSRGVYYQCSFCDKVELVEIRETFDGLTPDDVFPKFQKLPKGWGVMEVPYYDFAEQVWWSKTAHFCGVECAISYLKKLKSEQKAEAQELAKELKELGADEILKQVTEDAKKLFNHELPKEEKASGGMING